MESPARVTIGIRWVSSDLHREIGSPRGQGDRRDRPPHGLVGRHRIEFAFCQDEFCVVRFHQMPPKETPTAPFGKESLVFLLCHGARLEAEAGEAA